VLNKRPSNSRFEQGRVDAKAQCERRGHGGCEDPPALLSDGGVIGAAKAFRDETRDKGGMSPPFRISSNPEVRFP